MSDTPSLKKKTTIRTAIGEYTLKDKRGRVYERGTYLDSKVLLRTLHGIKDICPEPHTKINLQHLIDQIYELNPTL